MIPKIIHYVWLGPKAKPDSVLACIATWKKYCPDYEIREWNNKDIKNIHCDFFHEALESEYWAFASDYLRLYALKHFGGFYFDTDLELTHSIDEFTELDLVLGFEKTTSKITRISTAFMGSKPNQENICDLLHYYESHHFRKGSNVDLTPNTRIFTKYFGKKLGSRRFLSTQQLNISEKIKIFPSYYFCTPENGKENFAIHHFESSWIKDYYRIELLKLGSYRLLRFKKIKDTNATLPMLDNEKILWEWKYKKGTRFVVLSKTIQKY